MDKPLKQPKVHRCRCDISFPSRYLDASGPHGMMWRRTQKTQVLFDTLRVCTKLMGYNFIILLGILEYKKGQSVLPPVYQVRNAVGQNTISVFGDVSSLRASTSPSCFLFWWKIWVPRSRIKNRHAIRHPQIHFK